MSDTMTSEETDEELAKPCHWCGGKIDLESRHETTLHHEADMRLYTVRVPRCKTCSFRHNLGMWAMGVPGLLLTGAGVFGARLFKRSDVPSAKIAAISAVVVGILLMLASMKLWQPLAKMIWGLPTEDHANEHPMIKELLAKGCKPGPLPERKDAAKT